MSPKEEPNRIAGWMPFNQST